MKRIFLSAALVALSACRKADDEPAPLPATPDAQAEFDAAAARLETGDLTISPPAAGPFVDETGHVVSRKSSGEADDTGDSLIWSGTALWALDCEQGKALEQTLAAEILALDGALERHPSLPGQVSLDGALGLYKGIAGRITRCPGSAEIWRPVVAAHLAKVGELGGRLNPGSDARLELGFGYVLDLLASRLGLREAPDDDRLNGEGQLAWQIAAWAFGVTAKRAACFRLNLGWLALTTVEDLGVSVASARRDGFCAATLHADSPLVDNWCGRGDLVAWVHAFQFNVYTYRHQTCGGWQSPDAGDRTTPGLDKLAAMRVAYNLRP